MKGVNTLVMLLCLLFVSTYGTEVTYAFQSDVRGNLKESSPTGESVLPADGQGENFPAMALPDESPDMENRSVFLYDTQVEDQTPPKIKYISPADGATDVPINLDRITVKFDENMDRESLIQGGTIYFTDSQGNLMHVNFRLWYDDGLQLQFYYLLEPNSTYYIHVTTNATDLAGNHLEEEYISSFTTVNPPPDPDPPFVNSVSPNNGATDVPINIDRITVRFNEDMNRQSLIEGSTIYFTDEYGTLMRVNFRLWFDNGLQLQFYYLLEPNSTYFIHVTTNAADLAGNHLEEEFISSFTTTDLSNDNEPPFVSRVTPADGATGVPINTDRITVKFNEDMNRESLIQGGTIYFTDSLGNLMHVNFRVWYDDGLQLQFYYLLEPNSTYFVHVTTNAKDLAGNHLAEEFISSFTTETLNEPPVAYAGEDLSLSAGPDCIAEVLLDGTGSYDPDGDQITYLWENSFGSIYGSSPTVTLFKGSHKINLIVEDEYGATDSDSVMIYIEDKTAPTIGSVIANPNILWPPNHGMQPVTVTVDVSDNCDEIPNCQIISVSSNEPIDGPGDPNTEIDWEITGDMTVDLRAERSGVGDGRIYAIEVLCSDASGNSSTANINVFVPHDKGKGKKK